jgi:hypothetical protein
MGANRRSSGFLDTGGREPLEWNTSLMTRVLSRSLTVEQPTSSQSTTRYPPTELGDCAPGSVGVG